MQKFYLAAGHNVIRAFSKANISFPITKKELLDRAGKAAIQVDFDKSITLADYCKDIKLDKFANKSQFFNALIGSTFKL
ncbi:MAG: hypothetical protein LBF64_03275 [Oscillospiraceae bacterium]|jgi:hypothetical protein|nr:hypothetical protein [Oscillospiraceae bacterium]